MSTATNPPYSFPKFSVVSAKMGLVPNDLRERFNTAKPPVSQAASTTEYFNSFFGFSFSSSSFEIVKKVKTSTYFLKFSNLVF